MPGFCSTNQAEIPTQYISPPPLGFSSHGLSAGKPPVAPTQPSFTQGWYFLTPALSVLGCQGAILVTTVSQHLPVQDWAQRSGLLMDG